MWRRMTDSMQLAHVCGDVALSRWPADKPSELSAAVWELPRVSVARRIQHVRSIRQTLQRPAAAARHEAHTVVVEAWRPHLGLRTHVHTSAFIACACYLLRRP